MIKVSVNRQSAVCHKSATEYITTGQVGQEIVFEFSEAWDGFSKTAVFKGSGVKKDALLVSDRCEIPHECLTVPGDVLSVGVYGIKGDKVTPTIYCIIDRIKEGADPSGEESEGATPELWQQAIDAAGQANEKAQELLDMAARGELDGEPGPRGFSGVYVGAGEMPDGYNVQIDPNGEPTRMYTPAECQAAFLRYAHKKLKNYSINNSQYVDPSGYLKGSYTTPADLFRIGLIVASNSRSYKYWGGREKYATVNIMGKNAREVTFPDLWNGVGGTRFCNKSGGVTHSDGKHRAGFQLTTLNNKQAAISLMIEGAEHYDYITTYISNIKQMLRDLDDGKTVTEPEGLASMVAAGGGYVASFLPEDISKYQQVTFNQMISSDGTSGVLKDFMIRNNPNVKRAPASTTKIITLMCALDALGGSDLDTVEVTEDDITGGSGIELFVGDKLTVGDALFALMVSSSNTIATTLARYIGRKVLASEEV